MSPYLHAKARPSVEQQGGRYELANIILEFFLFFYRNSKEILRCFLRYSENISFKIEYLSITWAKHKGTKQQHCIRQKDKKQTK